MEGFLLLCVLSLAMFFGSYFSGYVPLAVTFSESKLRMVTVFGAGLLVGTALAVIIPEGVQSIYEAQTDLHNHQFHGSPSHHHEAEKILEDVKVKPGQTAGEKPPPKKEIPEANLPETGDKIDSKNASPQKEVPITDVKKDDKKETEGEQKTVRKKRESSEEIKRVKRAEQKPVIQLNQNEQKIISEQSKTVGDQKHTHGGGSYVNVDVHSVIGFALVVGFIFMLIVDQISRATLTRDTESNSVQPRYKMTATIGLVVHAAADGIALGAASTTKHTDIQFIVFMAIMLHKAPAAFGLVTFLLHEGLDKSRVRKHLLVFALAAPVLAVITYIGVKQGGSETLSSLTTTGVLMLFSAGTFLYVATVHVLPEIVSQSPYTPLPADDGTLKISIGHSHSHGGGFTFNELVALVIGSFIPCLLTMGHSH